MGQVQYADPALPTSVILIPDGSQQFYLLMHFTGIQKLLSPQAADVLLFPICKY